MATAVVTKQTVIKLDGSNDFQVGIHVVITEGETVLLEKDYFETYNTGTTVGSIKSALQAQLSADWDRLVSEQAIYDAAAYGTMVAQIETAANAYIS